MPFLKYGYIVANRYAIQTKNDSNGLRCVQRQVSAHYNTTTLLCPRMQLCII